MFKEASAYIEDQFVNMKDLGDEKKVYAHYTCATDTNNIMHVFTDVTDIIITNNLRACGLV